MLLSDLPSEILEQIFALLDPLAIVKHRQISKQFLGLISSSVDLTLRIELASDGLLLRSRDLFLHYRSPSAQELLRHLLATRTAWRRLEPLQTWSIGAPNNERLAFEICDGAWGRTALRHGPDLFRAIEYLELAPSSDHTVALAGDEVSRLHPWRKPPEDLGMVIADFSFMPSQDLQVLLEATGESSRRMHLLTISTHKKHPRASLPFFDIVGSRPRHVEGCEILLFEDRVAMVFLRWARRLRENGGVMVWDWKEGTLLMPYSNVIDAAFLTRDHMLLIKDWDDDGRVNLGLYNLLDQKTTHILELPLAQTVRSSIIIAHPSHHYGYKSPAQTTGAFKADGDIEILLLEIRLTGPDSGIIHVVISISKVLDICKSLSKGDDVEDDSPLFVKWRNWGMDATRWFSADKIFRASVRCTYGSKMIAFATDDVYDDPESILATSGNQMPPTLTPNLLVVLDFNPRSLIRYPDDEVGEKSRSVVFRSPSLWKGVNGGRKVVSRLPFRATISNEPWDYPNVYLDSTGLIARKVAKRFRNLIDNSIEIQLQIELSVDGLILESRRGWDAFSLVSRFRATRDALSALVPFQEISLGYPAFSKFAFEIQDGYWCRTGDATGDARFRKLDYLNLDLQGVPQDCDELEHRKIEPSGFGNFHSTFSDLGFNMCDLTFAPGCDLQLLLEAPLDNNPFQRLYFRTISTNQPHPLASKPYIELESQGLSETHNFSILLFEDRFAVIRYRWEGQYRRGDVSIWNWMQGTQLTALPAILDAAFLSYDELLVIVENENEDPEFGIYSIPSSTITHILRLPSLRSMLMAEVYSHSNSSSLLEVNQPASPMLRTDPEASVLAVRFFANISMFTSFSIVISIGRVLQTLHTHQTDDKSSSPSILAWDIWGPKCSRWFLPDELYPSSIRSTRGSRIAVWGLPNMLKPVISKFRTTEQTSLEAREANLFVILDFNARSFRGRSDYTKLQRSEVIIMKSPSVWRDSSGTLDIEVTTELPFCAIVGTPVWTYEDVYVDASALICREGGTYDILSFLPKGRD
ncbi:hypothetical protein FRC19_007186 [Serendipita sp. 401]|nr:hypothetical protein FRC19_007186 [Serendipita sp. 401]